MKEHFQKIVWHFNPPNTSHMIGAWERLVRSVKNAMGSVKYERITSEEMMRSVLADCDSIVNSRPLNIGRNGRKRIRSINSESLLVGIVSRCKTSW